MSCALEKGLNAIQEVQRRFCLIDLEGILYILDRQQIYEVLNGPGNKQIYYYRRSEGNIKIERFLESSSLPLKTKDVKAVLHDFLRSPSTLQYESVAFHPTPQGQNVLNFWRPHAVTPKAGSYGAIADLLFTVLCNRNDEYFDWLAGFLAHMIQRPWEKPDVAIVLLGRQGTGKGMFYRLLKAIWPHTMLQVHDIEDVVGKFTSALERNYGIWMDEALFTHDKRSMEKLKAVISEHQIRIEEKFEPKRTIDSLHRIFAASNNDHFGNISSDDRRFFILRLSDCHKQDHAYFADYLRALGDGTSVPAFVHALMDLDLEDFNVHLRPKTAEHGEQKLKSLQGLERFIYEVLQAGEFPEGFVFGGHRAWNESMRVTTEQLKIYYKAFDKNAERHRSLLAREMVQKLKAIIPSVESQRWQENNRQNRGLVFPPLIVARDEFETYIGFKCDWDD